MLTKAPGSKVFAQDGNSSFDSDIHCQYLKILKSYRIQGRSAIWSLRLPPFLPPSLSICLYRSPSPSLCTPCPTSSSLHPLPLSCTRSPFLSSPVPINQDRRPPSTSFAFALICTLLVRHLLPSSWALIRHMLAMLRALSFLTLIVLQADDETTHFANRSPKTVCKEARTQKKERNVHNSNNFSNHVEISLHLHRSSGIREGGVGE